VNLAGLAEKYRILVELRARREEVAALGLEAFPPEEAAIRRRRFRVLARRFPSALAELELPLTELRRRHAIALGGLRGELSPPESDWARAMAERHLLLRLALSARRLAKGGRGGERFAERCRRLEDRAAARGLDAPSRASVARALGIRPKELYDFVCHPPGGRLRPLVDRVVGLASDD